MNIRILYEDNHLIAVFKPAGVLSQGYLPAGRQAKRGDIVMLEEVRKYLKEKYKKPGNVFLGLLHRLDRPVSGIILFAKTSKGASRLSEQFRNHQVEKTYHAIVIGKQKESRGVLMHKIQKSKFKNKNDNVKFKSIVQNKKGNEVALYYEVVQSNNKYSLLKIKLETGKFHQIRSQLSLAGFPILGDVKYLPAGRQVEREWHDKHSIALCATGLSFKKATGDKIINLSIPIPFELSTPQGLDLLS